MGADRGGATDRGDAAGSARGRTAADWAKPSYYGVPTVHKPHWRWLIIGYFFLGGIAGASYVIAAVSDLVGPKDDRRIVRAGRYLSLAALMPCPILLILDLARPRRFIYMLRVLKLRSPMSVGTWGLLVFSAISGLSAARQAADDGLLGHGRPARGLSGLPARAMAVVGIPFGFFLAGYTGVLLATTAVPLWAKNARVMGPLFLCSAFSTATAAITLLLSLGRPPHASLHRLERLERTAMAAEIGLLAASWGRLGPTAKPVVEGRIGRLLRFGTIGAGLVGPLALQVVGSRVGGRPERSARALASILVLVGGFLFRYAVVMGGRASADDPHATFAYAAAPAERSDDPPRSTGHSARMGNSDA